MCGWGFGVMRRRERVSATARSRLPGVPESGQDDVQARQGAAHPPPGPPQGMLALPPSQHSRAATYLVMPHYFALLYLGFGAGQLGIRLPWLQAAVEH